MLEIKILFGGGFYIQYKVLWPLFPLIHLISFTTFRRLEIQSLNQTAVGLFYIYIYAFSKRFNPKWLTVHSGYIFFVSMCVPWECMYFN